MSNKGTLPVLSVFFSTEMWERYGFYVVQSLLALFLSLHFNFDDNKTYMLVGSFTAITYISPIVGGFIADHCLGQKKAILFGIIILFSSYIILSNSDQLQTLLIALAAIAIGTGLLKPNISALLGQQYIQGCQQRDSGFIIFYLGITSGIILGTTLPNIIHDLYGWHACFLSAAFGLFLAFLFFYFGIKLVKIKQKFISPQNMFISWFKAISLTTISFVTFLLVLSKPNIANLFFIIIAIAAIFIVFKIAAGEQGIQRRQTIALLLLFVSSVFFWAFYFQMFTTLTLFITRAVKPTFLGLDFPAPYYIAVQSFGMIVIGMFLAKVLAGAKTKNDAFSVGKKFTFAIACVLIAYIIILLVIKCSSLNNLISVWPIISAYLILSLAELMLSPIGLAAVTNLSSPKVVSTMMGVFFVSLGLGGFLSGQLAKITALNNTSMSIVNLKLHYSHGFQIFILMLTGVLILSCILTYIIKRLTLSSVV